MSYSSETTTNLGINFYAAAEQLTAQAQPAKNELHLVPYVMNSLPIGTIIPVACSADYVPDGCLPCDGTEYFGETYNGLWENYLTPDVPLLKTCTYEEYAASISTYGQCGSFAIDRTNEKFKTPTIKNGSFIQQAKTNDQLGATFNAGLPNITGTWVTGWDSNFIPTILTDGAVSTESRSAYQHTSTAGSKVSQPFQATFDASKSNAIYGKSTTVQPNAIAYRYFVVVANGTASGEAFSLAVASMDTLGGIKPDGTSLVVDPETGVASAIGSGGMNNPMTATGDIIVGGEVSEGVAIPERVGVPEEDGTYYHSVTIMDGVPVHGWEDISSIVEDGQWVESNAVLSTDIVAGEYSIDLSEHVPVDEQSYELLLNLQCSSSAGSTYYLTGGGIIESDVLISQLTAEYTGNTNTLIFPVASRTITLKITGNDATATTLSLLAYRKTGIGYGNSFKLPIASADTLGGIIPDGTTITVDPETGIASAVGGGGSSVTPASYVVDAGTTTKTWYRLWSDGRLEQGGTGTATGTLTFPIAYANTNYRFVCAPIRVDSSDGTNDINWHTKTETQIGVEIRYDGTCQIGQQYDWYACGDSVDGESSSEEPAIYVVDSGATDNAWYRIWSDGTLEQGGTGRATGTLTFPIAYADATYQFICAPIRVDTSDGTNDINWHTKTATKIGVEIRYDGTCQIYQEYDWYAFGKKSSI